MKKCSSSNSIGCKQHQQLAEGMRRNDTYVCIFLPIWVIEAHQSVCWSIDGHKQLMGSMVCLAGDDGGGAGPKGPTDKRLAALTRYFAAQGNGSR